ncbi:MAG: hypothetical protein NTV22_15520 [bacterium]|nr:hypothetical protein [bacterium]
MDPVIIIEDDRLIAHPMYAMVCFNCRHFHDFQEPQGRALNPITCDAFPKGIPDGMLARGEHRTPYPGDHGIQFEPIDKATVK